MKKQALWMVFLLSIVFVSQTMAQEKTKIFVVDSYHPEYMWSQDTHEGVSQGLLDFGFLESEEEAGAYTRNDYVEGAKAIIKKTWMDTKRKNSQSEIANVTARIVEEIEAFQPDILLLGDDNAVNFIGNQYVDTDIPVVFWGVNGLPLKYGLLDSVERPGHNVTGIYQEGYLMENLDYLKRLVPDIKTFSVLSDDSPTGRAGVKRLENLDRQGKLPLKLMMTITTNSFSEWKKKALEASQISDAFFVLNHNTLKDEQGNPVDQMKAGAWYLGNIRKPDCAYEKQFVEEGILLAVDDSGFKQGYEAVRLANDILHEGKAPAMISSYAPDRGPVMVNRNRAKQLGIDLSGEDFVEEWVDESLALEEKTGS
ncbi:MAG: hypothetical protein JW893_02905 [Candidatus Omnitrophica bacterium]|nr:hypothetical protein [Candidatus Omnitrophota bacterium]